MPSNRVHLCVDMQRMFVEATPWHIETMAATLPGIEALVERDPEATVFTRFIPPPPETVRGAWLNYYAAWPQMAGDRVPAELLELTPTLQRFSASARTLDKPVLSPWWSGELHQHLRARGVDTLIITGGETDVCVLATVMGAIDLGYHMLLPTDGLSSSAESCHSAMLSIYGSRFGSHLATTTIPDLLEDWR